MATHRSRTDKVQAGHTAYEYHIAQYGPNEQIRAADQAVWTKRNPERDKVENPHLSGAAVAEGWRYLTWLIGTEEFQKSAMARETFDLLKAGVTNTRAIRARIRQKRKVMAKDVMKGRPNSHPDNKLVNEHAWVTAKMTERGMTTPVNQRTHETRLLPGAEEQLESLISELKALEPFEWKPDE